MVKLTDWDFQVQPRLELAINGVVCFMRNNIFYLNNVLQLLIGPIVASHVLNILSQDECTTILEFLISTRQQKQ
jgi:hypothetical protein